MRKLTKIYESPPDAVLKDLVRPRRKPDILDGTEELVGRLVSIKPVSAEHMSQNIDPLANCIISIEKVGEEEAAVRVAGRIDDWEFSLGRIGLRAFVEGRQAQSGNYFINLM